ncbi:hypothetical protein PI23P_08300 [Polaribacter irgensii 23-P]|uniref:Uncharacterized protein n=1 Tax=Polaribacter irgensii 23-P TaxID=313594 RepID=A4BZL9_9FLAO|nr:hypothetical protein PI23P_08300 [Polaribacter irgensii 23-P]
MNRTKTPETQSEQRNHNFANTIYKLLLVLANLRKSKRTFMVCVLFSKLVAIDTQPRLYKQVRPKHNKSTYEKN